MIETIQDAIITQLETIPGVVSVGAWQGDIDDLLKTPQRQPALHVIYQGANFEEKMTVGGDQPGLMVDFLVVLVGKNLRSRDAGATACYTIIEAVRDKLIGYRVAGYDILWPISEELIHAEGGILVYGMNYRMDTILWERD